MIAFKKIFEHWNRGLLIDFSVFLFQLLLLRLLTTIVLRFVRLAEDDRLVTTAIGSFWSDSLFCNR